MRIIILIQVRDVFCEGAGMQNTSQILIFDAISEGASNVIMCDRLAHGRLCPRALVARNGRTGRTAGSG